MAINMGQENGNDLDRLNTETANNTNIRRHANSQNHIDQKSIASEDPLNEEDIENDLDRIDAETQTELDENVQDVETLATGMMGQDRINAETRNMLHTESLKKINKKKKRKKRKDLDRIKAVTTNAEVRSLTEAKIG